MEKSRIKIRSMDKNDIDFVISLGNKTSELWIDNKIKFAFNKKMLKKWIKTHNEGLFIFEFKNEKIGFAIISIYEKMAEIIAYVLKKEYRGQGIGKKIFQELLKKLERKGVDTEYLYTETDNKRAINLYKSFGFKKGRKLFFMHKGWQK